MTKPMIYRGYEIKWNPETCVFEVKTTGGKEVLFADAVGKKCYDWVNSKNEALEEELEELNMEELEEKYFGEEAE